MADSTLPGVITQPETSLRSTSLLGGRYEIVDLIGVGGMSTVYRARDVRLGDPIAIKVLRPEVAALPGMVERFRREVSLARRVTHKNVARVFDIDESEAGCFLTMELVEGESLGARLARRGPVEECELAAIAIEVCEGLAAAHDAGVIHRDLKPDNILLGRDGRVLVTDFGIASALLAPGDATRVGLAIGTPAYMAPEQVEGRVDVDARADIYALGASLFELATGAPPWSGGNVLAVAAARLHSEPPDAAASGRVTRAMADVIKTCMAKQATHRFASAGELAVALRAVLTQDRSLPPPTNALAATLRARPAGGAAGDRSVALTVTTESADPTCIATAPALRDLLCQYVRARKGVPVVPLDNGLDAPGDVQLAARFVLAVGADGQLTASLALHAGADATLRVRDTRSVGHRDVFGLATRLGEIVAGELLLPPGGEFPPSAPAVAALWLEAQHAARSRRADDRDRAIALYEEALSLAPHDPWVQAAYAATLVARFHSEEEESRDLVEARAMANAALRVSSVFGEAWLARGLSTLALGEHSAAVEDLQQALAALPGSGVAHLARGSLLARCGEIARGLLRIDRAIELEPTLAEAHAERAYVLALSGRTADAIAAIESGIAGTQRGATLWLMAARLCAWRHDYRGAASLAAEARRTPFERRDGVLTLLDAVTLGHTGAMRDRLRELVARDAGARQRALQARAMLAELAALDSDFPAVLDLLQEITDDPAFHDATWLHACPLLAPARSSPRFAAMVAAVDLRCRQLRLRLDQTTGTS